MQLETINNVASSETRKHLRVATISTEKNALSFLYIGTDEKSIRALATTFSTGIIAETIEHACQLIRSENLGQDTVDVILVDVPYHTKELQHFQAFLRTAGPVMASTPVLYNERHLASATEALNADLVDDVIDLRNWQFDFASKISFLKKAKEHNYNQKVEATRIKAASCIYKRTFDIAVSLALLTLLLPIFLVIALAIRIESRGPIFYNAKRAGRGFRIFKFYKFRTMVVNADKKIEQLAHLNQYSDASNGPKFFKIANDPRVTKVGKFLRNTSLDELPQLFNVLKGDMSLVGNRPLPLYEAATLTTNEFVERFMAPAGITGLWQIKKRGKADMSVEERISLDISYARKSTLLYDLWIMANTPGALIQKSDV